MTTKALSRSSGSLDVLCDDTVRLVLSFLDPATLGRVRRGCRRLLRLASDRELWKTHCLRFFSRKRFFNALSAPDVPFESQGPACSSSRHGSSLSPAAKRRKLGLGKPTPVMGVQRVCDWRLLYLLHYNWDVGRCSVKSCSVPVQVSALQYTASGGLYMASGRRMFGAGGGKRYCKEFNHPVTVMAADQGGGGRRMAVGFSNGAWCVLDGDGRVECESGVGGREIVALACCGEAVVVVDDEFRLAAVDVGGCQPRVVDSVKCHTHHGPLDVYLARDEECQNGYRCVVAFVVPSYPRGYHVHLQTIRFSLSTPSTTKQTPSSSAKKAPNCLKPIQTDNLLTLPLSWSGIDLLKVKTPFVVSGHTDHSIRVFHMAPTQGIVSYASTLHGHTSRITSLDMTSQGKVVSGAQDRSIRVWECLRNDRWHVTTLRDSQWDDALDRRAGFVWTGVDDAKVVSVFRTYRTPADNHDSSSNTDKDGMGADSVKVWSFSGSHEDNDDDEAGLWWHEGGLEELLAASPSPPSSTRPL